MDKIEPTSAGFDPLEEATLAAQVVCRGDRRKYYRFRPAKFYGGIATADCLGCCLRCLFCWSWPKVIAPGQYGKFYSPAQVADKLTDIALEKGFHQLRISGAPALRPRGLQRQAAVRVAHHVHILNGQARHGRRLAALQGGQWAVEGARGAVACEVEAALGHVRFDRAPGLRQLGGDGLALREEAAAVLHYCF